MNATDFIKEHGVEKAREVVGGAPEGFKGYNDVINKYTRGVWFSRDVLLSDLKRLVLRLDLIDRLGGINKASELFVKYQHLGESCFQEYLQCSSRSLEQAIADYESIYSDNDTIFGD